MQQRQPATDHKDTKQDEGPPRFVRWLCLVAGLLIGLLAALTIWLPEITDRWKFAAGNLFSFLALIVIVAQAIIYQRQREIMNEALGQNERLLKAVEDQRKAMHGQASGMALQARITKQAYQTSERAYPAVTTARLDNFKIGHVPVITVTIENGGRTPAWDIWLRGRIVMVHKGYPPKYAPKDQTTASDRVISVILPKRDRFIEMRLKGVVIDAKIYSRVIVGLHKMFFQGDLCYRDICGDNQTIPVRIVYRPLKGMFSDYRKEWDEDEQ